MRKNSGNKEVHTGKPILGRSFLGITVDIEA